MIDRFAEDTVIARDHRVTMEAILTRDQRTTSHRVLDRRYLQDTALSSSTTMTTATTTTTTMTTTTTTTTTSVRNVTAACLEMTKVPTNERTACGSNVSCEPCFVRCSSTRGIRRFTTTWLRLGSLLVTLLVVSVHGAPTMTLEDARLRSTPKWINPCGLAAEDFDSDLDVVQLQDKQLLAQVVLQAKTALMHAQLFRDDYVKKTFNTDFADLHSTWKHNHYDWLPSLKEIPKQLGEQLKKEFLDKLELDTALLDAYEYMQRYAVGLEQIVWDQEDHHLEYRNQFKDTEFKLRSVLCELQVAVVERGVTSRPDVTRDSMSSEYRAMSASTTYRNLRDWLIFRDYMNGLEYVVQVFEHLRQGLES